MCPLYHLATNVPHEERTSCAGMRGVVVVSHGVAFMCTPFGVVDDAWPVVSP